MISVVAAIITDHNQFLISQRKKGQHLAGLWEFPGGKIEQGESEYEALVRELKEEINIDVIEARPFKEMTHQYPDKSVHLKFWKVSRFNGVPNANEGQKLQWIELSAMQQLEFPEANHPILQSLNLADSIVITPDFSHLSMSEIEQKMATQIHSNAAKMILFRQKNMSPEQYGTVFKSLAQQFAVENIDIIAHAGCCRIQRDITHRWHLPSSHLNKKLDTSGELLLSASCHNLQEIQLAEEKNCRFAFLSPVLKTQSHPESDPLGWSQFKMLSQQTSMPLYALGGMRPDDMLNAHQHGARGIAGISSYWQSGRHLKAQ